MAVIVNIETATKVCSVSLSKDSELISIRESIIENSHSGQITVFVEEVLKESGISINNVDAFSVSKGPGSYTGLRIGVSTAKGFCFALDKPLISVGTLDSMTNGLINLNLFESSVLFCPMIDARRMEVYCAIFDHDNIMIKPVSAEIIDNLSFSEFLASSKIVFFGDGADKCKPILNSPNAVFYDEFNTSSKYMIELSEEKYQKNIFENIVTFEPYYLKDFIAGKPKVKGLL
jgi:tRNA threonylcarbamoyladenosine biosynthesis protein TsaB